MSISHILEDAERDEEQAEAAAAPAAAAGEQPPPREKGGEEGRYRVCVVPRVACREVKVALEGLAEPVFHMQEWNVRELVGICVRAVGGNRNDYGCVTTHAFALLCTDRGAGGGGAVGARW